MTTDLERALGALADRLAEPSPAPLAGIHDRARRRRRRTGLAGAAGSVMLLVVVVVSVVTVVPRLDADRPQRPAPTRVVPGPSTCPTGASAARAIRFPASGLVAGGAVSVRLCPDGTEGRGPDDVLTTRAGVDAIVDLVDAQPAYADAPDSPCPIEHNFSAYALLFTYPDGTVRRVTGRLGACDFLETGRASRSGAGLVYRAFADALVRQRHRSTPPARVGAARCPGEDDGGFGGTLLPRRRHLVIASARVCTFRWRRVGHSAYAFVRVRATPLDAHGVRRLERGFAAGARAVQPDYSAGRVLRSIVVVTDWGDRLTFYPMHGVLVEEPAVIGERPILGWRVDSADQRALFGPR